jgi:hypothetical protein
MTGSQNVTKTPPVLDLHESAARWKTFMMSTNEKDGHNTSAGSAEDNQSEISQIPNPSDELPSLRIYSRSNIFYWWPVWLFGFLFAFITYFQGGVIDVDQVRREWFHPSSALGLAYIFILMAVITFSNLTMRGIYSVTLLLTIAFLTVLFAWIGWWDEIFYFVPLLSVHMNMGFYLVFSSLVLVLWLLSFFIFDRVQYWRVRPGQLTREDMIGGAEETYDTRGMLVQEFSDDYFRHYLLGLGTDDISLQTAGAKQKTIRINNVLFANAKVDAIQRLVSVEPNKLMGEPDN